MRKMWILILSKRGFIQEPEIFLDHDTANKREKELIKDINPHYDEIELFEKSISNAAEGQKNQSQYDLEVEKDKLDRRLEEEVKVLALKSA